MAPLVALVLLGLLSLSGLDAVAQDFLFGSLPGSFCDELSLLSVLSPPKVQVYSRHPAENGKPNYLNCYVSGFHPPQIEIDLLKNGEKMNAEQSDLSFSKDWSFYLLVHTEFTPNAVDQYSCRVKHVTLDKPKIVKWDRDH